jgi:hypothetical protein
MDYNQVETGYAQQEEGHIKPRTSYVKTNKAAAQAKIGYAHKNQGYTAEVSTSRPSLYQLRKRWGPSDTLLEAP